MSSPFPGMDPYLEEPDNWAGFHTTLYVEIQGELNASLPPGFVARIDKYVWIHEPEARKRLLGKLAAPTQVLLPAVRREGGKFIKIVDSKSRRVVTVLEILSASNKDAGPDRDAYLLKRSEYLATGVNLIEVDLLRRGQRMPLGKGPPLTTPYLVLVSAAWDFPQAGVWPISLREALPSIPVPLSKEAAVVQLPLQKCFNLAFAKGRWEADFDYTEPPEPPLEEPDATWARGLLASWQTGKASPSP